MGPSLVVGIGSGVLTLVLWAAASAGNVFSGLLALLIPLPLFLAGFGWGVRAALISAATTCALIGALLGATHLGVFAAILSGPSVVLCYLASLHRVHNVEDGQGGSTAVVEWYPVERLIFWTVIFAGGIATAGFLSFWPNVESYLKDATPFVEKEVIPQLQKVFQDKLTDKEVEALTTGLPLVFPSAVAVTWFFLISFNMWLAMRIAQVSDRLIRAPIDLKSMRYPLMFSWAVMGALAVSFLGGTPGLLAGGFIGAFMAAYQILGLAIIHVVLPPSPIRFFLLSLVYFGTLVVGWLALPVILVGLSDAVVDWRSRFNKGAGQPPSAT